MKIKEFSLKWHMEIVDRNGKYLVECEHGRLEACKLDPDQHIWEVLRRVPRRFAKVIRKHLRQSISPRSK